MTAPKHAPRVPFAILFATLSIGGLCALLALNTASAANELNRHDLAVKDANVAAQVQQLQNQVAASAAPGALGSAAAALGMVPAGNPAFIKIGADGKVTVLGSPAPASLPVTAVPPSPPPTPKTTPTSKKATAKTAHNAKPTTKATKKASPTSTPAPTPTPTPTQTLPGGTR